jgi:hypothetical protein
LQGWVALLLKTQSFYITGLEDVDEARKNALGAMGCFMLTLAYSLYKIQFPDKTEESIDVSGPEGYQLNTGAPVYGSYT